MKEIKRNILVKALELFNNNGFTSVSLRQIASELQISHSNLIYHFKTKNDIVIALHQELLDKAFELNKTTIQNPNFLESLFESTKKGFEILYQYRFLMIEFNSILRESEKLKQIILEVENIRATMYRNAIDQAIEQGYIRGPEYDNEYGSFILTIKIFSDSWISSSEIYDATTTQEIIEKYSLLFIKLFFPYLTAKAKNEFFKMLDQRPL